MGLNLSKLENVRHHGSKVIARCPVCAEAGNDRKGEHLFIEPGDRFGCVVFPGTDGRKHRQRIFEMAGIKTGVQNGFKVRKPSSPVSEKKAIQKDILGRLGHIKTTHARKAGEEPMPKTQNPNEPINSVPTVPEHGRHPVVSGAEPLYLTNESEMLQGIDNESLERIDEVKRLFNGTVVSVIDRKP